MMSGQARGQVLVAEDDEAIRRVLRTHLSLDGFAVDEAPDGGSALERLRARPFELVVLDAILPVIDGIHVCRSIRASAVNRDVPILMMRGSATEADAVLGLEAGADDFLVKPFGLQELLARARALVARAARGRVAARRDLVSCDAVVLDRARRHAVVRGKAVRLTRQEFDLLVLLASHPGIVYSRTALLHHVAGREVYVTERTIDTLVSRVRRKVERDSSRPEMIRTVWGCGYKFRE